MLMEVAGSKQNHAGDDLAKKSSHINAQRKKADRRKLNTVRSPLTEELKTALQRRRTTRGLVTAILMTSDLASCALAFLFANLIYLGNFSWQHSGNLLAVCLPMFLLFAINNNAHSAMYIQRFWTGVGKALVALGLAGTCLLLVMFFLKTGAEFSRGVVLIGGLTCVAAFPAGRLLARKAFQRRVREGLYAQVCIFDGVPVKHLPGVVTLDANIDGMIPKLDSADSINRFGMLAKGLDRIIVHCSSESRSNWTKVLKALDISSEIVVPELDSFNALSISEFDGNGTLVLSVGTLKWNQSLMKRAFDIIVSSSALLLLSPILVGVALIVRLDSPGPALFRQERIGLGNRRFMIYKFRSMRTEAADPTAGKLTQKDDPRVTKVGDFIRRTSIDELPQLINVLIGDMSMVGPRPHAERATAGDRLYWEVDSAYWHRHVVKPGITGLAQISGHRGNTFHEDDLQKRLDADLIYVENWSFMEDVRIILKTFSVLTHKNAF
jgi:polysaccharide biosynthesis protein PslA